MSRVRLPAGIIVSIVLALAIVAQTFGFITAQTLDYVAMGSVFWLVMFSLMGSGLAIVLSGMGAVLAVGLLLWLQIRVPGLRYMPFILIVPANITMGWVFARGLFAGRRPVLVQLIELMNMRPVDPTFQRFVEGQCLLWSVMCGATAIVALAAMLVPVWRPELAIVLTVLVVAQIAWFALSHHYAQIRYHRPETCWLTFRTMLRRDIWARIRV